MANRKANRARAAQLGFEALVIEGGLLSPEWLSKVAQLAAETQTEADYRIPKGLNLRDEIGRYWRIAQAHWKDLALGLTRSKSLPLPAGEGRGEGERIPRTESAALAEHFILGLLRESFGFTTLAAVPPALLAERTYPLGHAALGTRVPVVIAPARSGLDALSPAFGDGSRRRSPFGLVQEYLNAADGALWGLVTDGLTLRVLRDNASLTRPAWIEADLARIFTEERYADFAALWLLIHESRFGRDGQPAAECALETWREAGKKEGTRAREHLRRGVEDALVALGQGFLAHPDNQALRAALQSGSLTTRDYFSQLLRLVYRLIFLLTVEERNLLHPTDTPEPVRRLYAQGYSLSRLCEKSVKRSAHDRFSDLWDSLKVVLRSLADGEPRLGLPALAGLFAPGQCPALDAAKLENRALLFALYKLAWLREDGALARVNWRDMGSEELGSVYESLLELIPRITDQGRQFGFITAAGNERKTTGSYYTPSSLVECLLDSALDPVVEQRLAGKWGADAAQAILSLRVCDPACGSGHFLIGAAHRLARRLAAVWADSEQPSMAQLRHALREVISHCLYGVDVNPMSVELCKVTLWLEATEPGKPLSFLDHHIQCGNSLLGATPRVLADGLPDDAFKPIEGDDKTVCAEAKKRNKSERQQLALFHGTETAPWQHLGNLPAAMLAVGTMSDDTADALHAKEQHYAELIRSTGYLGSRFLADAWCAAFVWKKTRDLPYPITNDVLRKIERNPHDCAPWMREEIERLRDRYQFFHWHLAFPEVFPVPGKSERPDNEHAGWNGGFDLILGNPPWDKIQPEEEKFFSSLRPDIAEASSAKVRKALIEALPTDDPRTHRVWEEYKRRVDGSCHFLRSSATLRFTGDGNLNSYRIFTELAAKLIGQTGRAGLVAQTGLATDESGKELFDHLLSSGRLCRFLDFENRGEFFVDVHQQFRFCLITIQGDAGIVASSSAEFGWLLHRLDELGETGRLVRLTANDLLLFNPSSKTCPVFTSTKDVEVSRRIYEHGEHVMLDENRRFERVDFLGELFNMTRDSALFLKEPPDVSLPLYEAKFIHQFDHRFATTSGGDVSDLAEAGKRDAARSIVPKSFVDTKVVRERTTKRGIGTNWLCGFRSIASPTNERTSIVAAFPFSAVGNSINLILGLTAPQALVFMANANSFVFDFCARQKISGSNVNIWIFKQLPVLPPATYAEPCAWAGQPAVTLRDWLLPRVLELTYTAWDLEPFARDCGWFGPPFVWDEARRFQLRCELDAAFFHLYGLNRADAAYILDTFPIVRRKDEAAHGTYRTKDAILALYDQFAECQRTGQPFFSPLTPPPGDIRACHPPRPSP